MDDPEIIMSPRCQEFEKDGHVVQVDIYGTGKNDWILEVLDADGNSTVWDGKFETDELALAEFHHTVEKEGIRAVIGSPTIETGNRNE